MSTVGAWIGGYVLSVSKKLKKSACLTIYVSIYLHAMEQKISGLSR